MRTPLDKRFFTLVDKAFDEAADSQGDYYVDSNGRERFNKENVFRSKLRVDTLLWMVSRFAPHNYVDRNGSLIQVNVNGNAMSPLGDTHESNAQGSNVITPEVLADLQERRRRSLERIRQANAMEVA